MTSFVLKIIALVTMFCDHFGDAYIGHYSFLNLIGRIAFPIFAFQISEGYTHTKNLKRYFFRLILFAAISQIPFTLFLKKFLPSSVGTINIFFTLTLGLLSITLYDYFNNIADSSKKLPRVFKQFFSILIVVLICYIGELLRVDYGFWGVFVIFIFYLFKNNKVLTAISYILLCILRYVFLILANGFNLAYIYMMIATIFPIVPILFYNGKKGISIKYLLYVFYPLHLLLLCLFF